MNFNSVLFLIKLYFVKDFLFCVGFLNEKEACTETLIIDTKASIGIVVFFNSTKLLKTMHFMY